MDGESMENLGGGGDGEGGGGGRRRDSSSNAAAADAASRTFCFAQSAMFAVCQGLPAVCCTGVMCRLSFCARSFMAVHLTIGQRTSIAVPPRQLSCPIKLEYNQLQH
jgi:hypothetical protein